MVMSACAAVPAYAEGAGAGETPGYYTDTDKPDYYAMSMMQGKKAGEIYGFFEGIRRLAAKLDGCEEIEKMAASMLDKTHAAFATARDATDAVFEVEQDKNRIEMLADATNGECVMILEGLGSSLGDPSGTARDVDIIAAGSLAAISDAKKAVENKDSSLAIRAMAELLDAEETQIKLIETCGGYDLYTRYNTLDDLYNRITEARDKTQADVEKSNALVDSYIAQFYSIIALMGSAYEKLLPIAESAPADSKAQYNNLLGMLNNHTAELKEDFFIKYFKYQQVDMSRFDGMIEEIKWEGGYYLNDARACAKSTLMPMFFVTSNNFTANGTAQPLVKTGTEIGAFDKSQVKFALGSKPAGFTDDMAAAPASLSDDAYSTAIPTATKEGTYYVYCRFPDYYSVATDFAVKVTVKKAAPKPTPAPVKPVKKANTLKVSGKTVKVKKNKKTVIKKEKAFTIRNAKGKVTFKKAKGNKKITVAKNGKITVKKGLKKGTYKVKVKVTAAGNATYKAATKTVTVTVKVK